MRGRAGRGGKMGEQREVGRGRGREERGREGKMRKGKGRKRSSYSQRLNWQLDI